MTSWSATVALQLPLSRYRSEGRREAIQVSKFRIGNDLTVGKHGYFGMFLLRLTILMPPICEIVIPGCKSRNQTRTA